MAKGLTQKRCEIILALADSNMNVSDAARRLYMCRGSIVYQIERIMEITGKDPLKFYDLYELTLLANGKEIQTMETEQKRGHWVIKYIKNSNYKYCYCSECLTMGSPQWKRCPVCEAKMRGDNE